MHWIGLVGILILVGCGGGTPTSSEKISEKVITKTKDQLSETKITIDEKKEIVDSKVVETKKEEVFTPKQSTEEEKFQEKLTNAETEGIEKLVELLKATTKEKEQTAIIERLRSQYDKSFLDMRLRIISSVFFFSKDLKQDEKVRSRAMEILGIPGYEKYEASNLLLQTKYPRVREFGIMLLRTKFTDFLKGDEFTRGRIISLLQDADPEVRKEAILALENIETDDVFTALETENKKKTNTHLEAIVQRMTQDRKNKADQEITEMKLQWQAFCNNPDSGIKKTVAVLIEKYAENSQCSEAYEALNMEPTFDLKSADITSIEPILVFTQLKELILNWNRNLIVLHPGIGRLRSLKQLHLWETSIKELPDMSGLTALERLSLSDDENLTQIHPSVWRLKTLKELDLRGANISELPDISGLAALERLSLFDDENLTQIHPSIGQLKTLKELDLHGTNISELPDMSGLAALERLSLSNNKNLTQIHPSIGQLKTLKELDLHGTNISELPDVSGLAALERLSLSNNKNLTQIHPSVWQLKTLKTLNLNSTDIKKLPDVSELVALEEFSASFANLEQLHQSIWQLKTLKMLNLKAIDVDLPDLSGLVALEELDLSRRDKRTTLHVSIGQLKTLKKLNLYDATLSELPDLSGLVALEELDLQKYSGKPWTVPKNLPLKKIVISKGTTKVIVPESLQSKVVEK